MTLNEIEEQIESKPFSVSSRWGQVGEVDGEIYRVIYNPKLIQNLGRLSIIIEKLIKLGLIQTEFLGMADSGNYILKHKKFTHQTFIHEWTFQQKKDAIILVLRLQRELRQHGFSLHDPHTNNVTFIDSRPVYFDFDSIHYDLPDVTILAERFWYGRKRPHQGWGVWLGINKALMDNLSYKYQNAEKLYTESIKTIKELQPDVRVSQWSRYSQALPKGMDVKRPETHAGKYGDATRMFQKHNLQHKAETVLDIGASRGMFTRCMLANGVKKVVAVDIDESVIEQFYKETKQEGLPVTCAYLNVMDKHVEFAERKASVDRLNCDLVLCIALVHHLCYFRGVKFGDLALQLWKFTNKYLMIEWIPYTDKCLTGITNKFGVDRPEYTEDNFLKAFGGFFNVVDVAPMTPDPRKVFLLKKKTRNKSGPYKED